MISRNICRGHTLRIGTGSIAFAAMAVFAFVAIATNAASAAEILNYTLNEDMGTSAVDHSGSGNSGTITGATWTGGISGSALDFNGANSYINAGNSSSLDFGTGSFTIEFWLNPSATAGNQFIIGKSGDASTDGWGITIQGGNIWGYFPGINSEVNAPISSGAWSYWAFVKDASGDILLYKNGDFVMSGRDPAVQNLTTSNNLEIGGRTHGSYQWYYSGTMDEIRISNAALAADQIKNNYDTIPSPAPALVPKWIIGSGGNSWNGNSILDDTYQNTNNNIELGFQSTYVDQANVITPTAKDYIYADQWLGQSFTANASGLFKTLNATIYKRGTPDGDLIISLYNTSGGNTPIGLPLATQSFRVSDVSSQSGWHLYNFSYPYKLIAGHKYAVVASSYYTNYENDYYTWDLDTAADTYPSGMLIGSHNQGGSWENNSQWDNPFEIITGNHYSSGNLTTWHNASNGSVVYKWAVNITVPENTSWSALGYDNQTGEYIETLADHSTASGYQEFTITQTMDYKVNLILFGDTDSTPEVTNEIFFNRAIGGTTPEIISWSNDKTGDDSLSLQIPKSTTVFFNVASNQSITNWYWENAAVQSGDGTANSNAERQFTDAGVYHVSVYGENSNGTTDVKTWTITVMADIEKTILILDTDNATNNQNNFAEYFEELLKLEGFNDYQKESIEYVSPEALANAKVVILPQIYLSQANKAMIMNYVNNGGLLIADRPPVDMGRLFGLSPQGSTISDRYLKIDNTAVIGRGLTNATMRFRGTADNYNVASGTTIAWLYSGYSTNSKHPAVHYANYGNGRAVIFTFSLRNDIINFTQGNASQASNLIPDIDGDGVYRASDLFYNWNDASLTDIPQANIQVNLLSNSIMELMRYNRPIARLWYFPNETLALNVWVGDGDSANYTLVDLETSDVHKYGKGNMSFYSLKSQWTTQEGDMIVSNGSGLSYHYWGYDYSRSWTPTIEYYSSLYAQNKIDFYNQYGFYGKTARHHYNVYVGWAEGAQIEADNLIQMDLNFIGVNPNVGLRYMTGSGLPIRFVDASGTVLDIYNQPSIFEDDLQLHYDDVPTALQKHKDALNDSINMYHTVITAVIHPYNWYYIPGERELWGIPYLSYSAANNVYTWSAENWNDFTRAREDASVSINSWDGQIYSFTVSGIQPADISQPFTLLLPSSFNGSNLSYIKRDGSYYPNRTIVLNGVSYTAISTTLGTHTFEASYSASAADNSPPQSISNLHNTTYERSYINWSWIDPADADFSSVMVYLNGSFKENIQKGTQFYKATGLHPDTSYTISTHTVDASGNINKTWVNRTARTAPSDILSYYRSLGNNPDVVETTDLLKAADDWSRNIAPPGFTAPITTQQLLALSDEWSKS